MAQWEFVEWLLFWLLETSHFEFEWDQWNRTKSAAKHGISTEEVEAVQDLPTRRRENNMKKSYAKSLKEYYEPVELDSKIFWPQ